MGIRESGGMRGALECTVCPVFPPPKGMYPDCSYCSTRGHVPCNGGYGNGHKDGADIRFRTPLPRTDSSRGYDREIRASRETKKKGKRRKTKRIAQANNAALPTSLTSGPTECAHALSNWFRICSRNTICQKLSFGYFVKNELFRQ